MTLLTVETQNGVSVATPNTDGGTLIGRNTTSKVGFYGKLPVVQRAYSSAVHATSALASSTDFGATQLAVVQEIQKTLIGLGVWATA